MPWTPCSRSASSSLHLSPSELRQMLTPDNVIEITELLYDHPTLYAHLLHFTSIHRTIKWLEETLETLQEEVSASQSPYVHRRPWFRPGSPHPQQQCMHRPPTPFLLPPGTRQNPIDVNDQESSSSYFTAIDDSLPSYSPTPLTPYGQQPSAGPSTPRCTYCNGRHTLAQCTWDTRAFCFHQAFTSHHPDTWRLPLPFVVHHYHSDSSHAPEYPRVPKSGIFGR
jgi:hypothetical protein